VRCRDQVSICYSCQTDWCCTWPVAQL